MKKLKASEEFVKGKHGLSWIGSTFTEKLGDLEFTLPKTPMTEIRTLTRPMLDKEILAEFKPAPVTLGDILVTLPTLDKSKYYIFYVNDSKGTLWPLSGDWSDGGWGVEADSVSCPDGWRAGGGFVSRRFFDTKNSKTFSSSDSLPSELKINGLIYRRDR